MAPAGGKLPGPIRRVQPDLQPHVVVPRTERFRPGSPRGNGVGSAPGVDTPAAHRSSDEPGVVLGAEPPNVFVVQEQLSVFHGP
jgi:hypothetical protein